MAKEHDIFIYNEIGWFGTDTEMVQAQINEAKELGAKKLTVHISSVGGSVFEGWAIGNIIKNSGMETVARIEGLCASIATHIALSCDTVQMSETGRFMIHNPQTYAEGEVDDMQKAIDMLESIKNDMVRVYTSRSNLSEDEVIAAMDAETWYTPEEAMKAGFVDEIIEPEKAVAKVRHADLAKYKAQKNRAKKSFKPNTKKMSENTAKDKKGVLNAIRNLFNEIGGALDEPTMMDVELEDGTLIFVESEDGELEGKAAYTTDEEGNPTDTPAPDGTHALRDGREIVVEGGMVTEVKEAEAKKDEEDETMTAQEYENRIAELENELETVKNEKETLQNELATAKEEVKASKDKLVNFKGKLEEIENMVSGGSFKREKPKTKPKNKFKGDEGNSKDQADHLSAWAKSFAGK